ncbi:MAG: hypothetical protein V2A67_01040 [Bacteroidota bacterium]
MKSILGLRIQKTATSEFKVIFSLKNGLEIIIPDIAIFMNSNDFGDDATKGTGNH